MTITYISDRDPGTYALVAAGQETSWAQASRARRVAKNESEKKVDDNRSKYTAKTQPRDPDGKFRRILARLKLNLGGDSTAELAKKIESAEAAQIAGNYALMHEAGSDIVKMIDGIDSGSIQKGLANNLRRGATDLGRVMAYLPLPQGDSNAKVRFTDLPPAGGDLVRKMVEQVKDSVDPDVAIKYTKELDEFMSGSRTMTSDEMSVFLNKLLRVLA